MANINQILETIKNAVLGKQVRQAIHDGIDAINKEVISTTTLSNNTKTRQDLLEQKYDEQIKELANEEPQLPEIVDARGGFNTLGGVIKQKIFHFDNVAEMKSCLTLEIGDVVQTLGYYAANDGGNESYRIVNNSNDDETIELNNGLCAELIYNENVYAHKYWGANLWIDTPNPSTYNETSVLNYKTTVLQAMRNQKMNTLYLPVKYFVNSDKIITGTNTSSIVYTSIPDALLNSLIDKAKELGFKKIVIKPHLSINSGVEITATELLTKWKNRMEVLANISLNNDLDTLFIGNEMETYSNSNFSEWKDIIDMIKEVGLKVTYSAEGFSEIYSMCFLKYLDEININLYPGLEKKYNINISDEKYAEVIGTNTLYDFRRTLREIKRLYNKPIIVSEMGSTSFTQGLYNPEVYTYEDTSFDPQLQAKFMKAMLKNLGSNSSYLDGIVLWCASQSTIENTSGYDFLSNEYTLNVFKKFNFEGVE